MTDTTEMKAKKAIGSYEHYAKIALKNQSHSHFLIRVGYRYTSEPEQFSRWFMLGPGENSIAFEQVSFWTGAFTSGQVQWKIKAIRMEPSHSDNDLAVKYKGTSYSHGPCFCSYDGCWAVHELRDSDKGKTATVEVHDDEIRIVSIGDGTKSLKWAE